MTYLMFNVVIILYDIYCSYMQIQFVNCFVLWHEVKNVIVFAHLNKFHAGHL